MRNPGLATSLRYRARRLRSRLGLAGLWAADRLEALADTVAVGLLRAGEPVLTAAATRITDYSRLNGGVGILRPVVPPRRSPTGLARRNDLLAIRAIAEHRPQASTWAVEIVLLELQERGVGVSIAAAEMIARRVVTAGAYSPLDARD